MKWPLSILFLLAATFAVAPRAGAKLCGDDVQGQDVPCACGDVVASNVALDTDPILDAPCSGDGLVVRAPGATQTVTVDLRGKTIRGTGQGTGLWVLAGGPGGAHVVSTGGPGSIVNFRDGLVGHGADSLGLLDGVVVAQSGRDGVRVESNGYEIRNTEAHDSARDGFAVSGLNYRVTGSRAVRSGRAGFYIMGTGATLGVSGAGIVADAGAGAGINLMGMDHTLTDCVATGNEDNGVHLYGMRIAVRGCTATDNGGDGIEGMGGDWQLSGNRADDNGNNGLLVYGMNLVDEGGNRGSGNRGLHQRRPPSQCEVSGWPCLP